MNNIYKLKFSRKTSELVAVSELATNAVAGSATTPVTTTPTAEAARPNNPLSSTLVKLGVLAGSALTLALGSVNPALANNGLIDPTVVAGSASIVTSGSVTTITNSPNTIINWQQFNIGKNELVQFIQESSNSAVLNRVLGNSVSEILGTLKSNGKVFLINPNGILFGANAVVDTNSLVASTLNMSDADFQAGKYVFNQEKDRAIASVLNQGVIKVQNDGTLALVGGNVVNTGILEAKNGSVYLLAGQSIQIADMNNPLISFKVTAGNKAVNLGEIVAKNVTMLAHGVNHGKDPVGNAFSDLYSTGSANSSRISATGEVELYAGSVSDQLQTNKQTNAQVTGERSGVAVINGEISVANATGKAGNVKVLADVVYVGNQSRIDASGSFGGNVNLGGDYQGKGELKLATSTYLNHGQTINVSGHGDAGTAIVWGERAQINGDFKAESETGKGGLVETSAKQIGIGELTNVSAKSGAGVTFNGKWLIDPQYLRVVSALPPNASSPSEGASTNSNLNGYYYYGNELNNGEQYLLNSTVEAALVKSGVELIAQNVEITGTTLNYQGDNVLYINGVHFNILDGSSVNVKYVNFQSRLPDPNYVAFKVDKSTFIAEKFTYNSKGWTNIQNSKVQFKDFEYKGYTFQTKGSTITVTNYADMDVGLNFRIYESSKITIQDLDLKSVPGSIEINGGSSFNVTNNFTYTGSAVVGISGAASFNTTNYSSTKGGLSLTGSSFLNATNVTTVGAVTITGSTLNITNNLTFNGKSGDKRIQTNSQVLAKEFLIDTDAHVRIINSAICVTDGNFTLTKSADLELSNSSICATKNVTVSSKDFYLWKGASSLVKAGENISITSANKATLNSKAQIEGKNIKLVLDNSGNAVTNKDTAIDIDDATFKATAGTVTVEAKNQLQKTKIKALTVTSTDKIDITSDASTELAIVDSSLTGTVVTVCATGTATLLNISNSTVNSTTGATTVNSAHDLKVEASSNLIGKISVDLVNAHALTLDTSCITAQAGITTRGNAQDVTINGVTFISRDKEISIGAGNILNLTVSNSHFTTGYTKDEITAATGSTLTSTPADINLNATNMSIAGSSFNSSQDLNLSSAAQTAFPAVPAQVKVTGTNVDVARSINITSETIALSGGQMKAQDTIKLNATKTLTITDSTKLDTPAKLTLEAAKGLTLTSAEVTGGTLEVKATEADANVSIGNSSLKSTKDTLTVTAGKNVTFTDGSKLEAKTTLDVTATNGGIDSTGTNFTSTDNNKVTLTGKEKVSLTNSNISGGALEVKATDGTLTVDGGSVKGASADFIAKEALEMKGGAKWDITGDVKLDSTNATAKVIDSNITSSAGKVTIQAKEIVEVSNSNISGKTGLTVTSTNSSATVAKSALTSEVAMSLTAATDLKVEDGSKLTSTSDLTLTATAGSLTVKDSNATATAGKVAATSAKTLTLENSNITGVGVKFSTTDKASGDIVIKGATVDGITGTLDVAAAKDVTIAKSDNPNQGSKLKADGQATVTAGGSLTMTDSNLSSKALAQVCATGTVSLSNSNITGASVEMKSTGAGVTVAGGLLCATDKSGSFTITGQEAVSITGGAKVDSQGSAKVESINATLAITDSNITAVGEAQVTAKEEITLKNSNISGSSTIINSSNASASVEGGLFCATSPTGAFTLTGKGAVEFKGGAKVDSKGTAKVASTESTVTVTDSNITAVGKAEVTAQKAVSLSNSNISGGSIDVKSTEKGVTVAGGLLTTTDENTGGLVVSGKEDVTVNGGAKFDSKGTAKVESKEGATTVKDSNITAAGKVDVLAKKQLTLENSNISGVGVTLTTIDANEGNIVVKGATVDAKTGALSVTAAKDITIEKGTDPVGGSKLSSQGAATVTAKGALTMTDSNITSTSGKASVSAGTALSMTNSNVSGTSLEVKSTGTDATIATVTISGGNFAATDEKAGELTVTAPGAVAITGGAKFDSKGSAKVESTAATLTVTDSNITAATTAQVSAQEKVTLSNSNISGSSVEAKSTNAGLEVTGGNLNATNAQGSLTLIGKTDVEVTGGAKLNSEGTAKVESKEGATTVKDSNITAAAAVDVLAKNKNTLDNSNITGVGVTIKNTDPTSGDILVKGTTVDAKAGDLSVTAAKDLTIEKSGNPDAGSKLSSQGAATVTATGALTMTDSNLTSSGAKASVSAGGALSMTNSNVSGTSAEVKSTGIGAGATVTVSGGNIAATDPKGALTVTADGTVEVKDGAKLDSKGSAKVESASSTLAVTGSNITAGTTAEVIAKNKVTLDNSNITGASVDIKSKDQGVDVTGGNFKATDEKGSFTLTGKESVSVTGGAKVDSKGTAKIESTNAGVTVTDSNITSTGKAEVTAKEAVALSNSNISGSSVDVKSTEQGVTVSGGNFNATDATGALTVSGVGAVEVKDGAKLNSEGSAKVESAGAGVTVADSNITSATKAEVKAATDVTLTNANVTGNNVVIDAIGGKVTLTDSNLASPTGAVDVNAKNEVTLTNSNLSGISVTVDSTEKGVTISDGSMTATAADGEIAVTGKTDVKVTDGAILDSKGAAKVESTTGAVTVTDSNITAATKAEVKAATDVTLTNANVTGNDVVVEATGGKVTLTDSNLASPTGKVDVNAQDEVTLTNSNLSGTSVTVDSTEKGVTISDGSMTATAADGEIAVIGKTDVKVTNGAILDSKGAAKVESTTGAVTVTDSNITAATKAEVKAATDVTLTNANVTGNDVVVEATGGKVTLTDSNLASPTGKVDVNAQDEVTLTNSNLSGTSVTVDSTEKGVIISDGSMTATAVDGEIAVTGKTDVKVTNGAILDSKGAAKVESTTGAVTVTDSNITAATKAEVKAATDVTLTNANVTGNNLVVTATGGNVSLKDSNLASPAGNVAVSAKGDIELNNSNITGKGVDLNSTENGVKLTAGSTITGTDPERTVNITGNTSVTIEDGAKVDSQGAVNVDATNGPLTVTDSNITSTSKVDLTAQDKITLSNANITGASVAVNSTAGTVDVNNTDVKVTDPEGSLTVIGDQGVKVENGSRLDSAGSASVAAPNGALAVVDSNITATDKVGLTAKDNITLNNANITGHGGVTVNSTAGNVETSGNSQLTSDKGKVDVVATGNITLGNGTKVTGADVSLNSTAGSIDVVGTNITAASGSVDITAKENVTIDNSNITGRNDVTITATNGTADIKDTALNSDNANVTVSGNQGTTVDNITATAGKDVNIKSPNGNVSANNVTATAGNNITLAAPNGNLTSTGGKYVGDNLLASSQGDLVFTDNHVELEGVAVFKVTDGKLDLERNSGHGSTLVLEYPSVDKFTDLDNTWVFSKVAKTSKQILTPEVELEDPLKPEDMLRNDIYRDDMRGMGDAGVTLSFDGKHNSLQTAPLNQKGTILSTDSNEETNLTLDTDSAVATNSNNNNNTGVASTSIPVTLGSCPAQAQAIAVKYGMSPADYSGLNLTDLKRKYQMSEADAQQMKSSCNINFDWDKMSIKQFLGK